MDPIKEAFVRAKQDIQDLKSQINSLTSSLNEIKRTLFEIQSSTHLQNNPTDRQITPTNQQTDISENPLYDLKSPNFEFSTGNKGVPTDKQTNQQTDKHTYIEEKSALEEEKNTQKTENETRTSSLNNVSLILDSLDSIKQEIRHKFKRLTPQEMAVFSLIYEFQDQGKVADYYSLSSRFSLSETSIRDYTHKIIKKGIPLIKTKENNKKVSLKISPDLLKIASLSTIMQLREI